MKWIASFLLAAGVCLLGGCAHRQVTGEVPYWQVVSTDIEGCWISEYIAAGEVIEVCDGYRFRAVQRRTFRPVVLTYRYPLGRNVVAKAPNIVITPTAKPLWLKVMDKVTPPPDQCRISKIRCYRK